MKDLTVHFKPMLLPPLMAPCSMSRREYSSPLARLTSLGSHSMIRVVTSSSDPGPTMDSRFDPLALSNTFLSDMDFRLTLLCNMIQEVILQLLCLMVNGA